MHAHASLDRSTPADSGFDAGIGSGSWSMPGDSPLGVDEGDWLEGDGASALIAYDDDAWDFPIGAAHMGIP